MLNSLVDDIAGIIGNMPLANAIDRSIRTALADVRVHLAASQDSWVVFEHSLNAAIRDIKMHPLGKLFRRLIAYGPHDPGHPEKLTSDGETVLSDPECGVCVEFIYSHMINRFKGELAELLALEPCLALIEDLRGKGRLPKDTQVYWGDLIQERRQGKPAAELEQREWQNFVKGADGLLAEPISPGPDRSDPVLVIDGIVEVKSMVRSRKRLMAQIDHHLERLSGGVKIGSDEWHPHQVTFARGHERSPKRARPVSIMAVPANWKLNREWQRVKNEKGDAFVFPESTEPPVSAQSEELEPDVWKITLAWSQEALNQAAYEMTFWYMSQVGQHVYSKDYLPNGWTEMTPAEAGYNAIKMMLYYLLLRPISKRQERLAVRLYNVYSFGYPIGADSHEMLWPEDLSA